MYKTSCNIKTPFPAGSGLSVYPYQQRLRTCPFDGNDTANCGALLSLV